MQFINNSFLSKKLTCSWLKEKPWKITAFLGFQIFHHTKIIPVFHTSFGLDCKGLLFSKENKIFSLMSLKDSMFHQILNLDQISWTWEQFQNKWSIISASWLPRGQFVSRPATFLPKKDLTDNNWLTIFHMNNLIFVEILSFQNACHFSVAEFL